MDLDVTRGTSFLQLPIPAASSILTSYCIEFGSFSCPPSTPNSDREATLPHVSPRLSPLPPLNNSRCGIAHYKCGDIVDISNGDGPYLFPSGRMSVDMVWMI